MLFAGWKNEFNFGYNLPLNSVLTVDGVVNTLQVPLNSAITDAVIDVIYLEVSVLSFAMLLSSINYCYVGAFAIWRY